MPVYNNPDFRRPPPELAAVFAAAGRQSFFSLPEWYDLLGRCLTSTGSEIRIYTDESPGSMIGVPLQIVKEKGRERFTSLANFYSVEHGMIAASDADLDRGVGAILAEMNAERPRWHRLDFVDLDPRDPGYHVLVRRLRRTGAMVECTTGAGTWYETTNGIQYADYVAVYASSWKPAEPFPQFIPELMRLAAGLGALRLGIYYLDRIPAAAQFWIIWRGRAIIYKLAHNQKFDQFSLGTLLTMEMLERVLS